MKGTAFVAMAAFLLVACGVEQIEKRAQGLVVAPLDTAPPAPLPASTPPSSPDAAPRPVVSGDDAGAGGACVSFQAVTCTVYPTDHKAECEANYGMWREDGNCFDRDRAPILGCELDGVTEWFFSHYEMPTDAEIEAAKNSCADGGLL